MRSLRRACVLFMPASLNPYARAVHMHYMFQRGRPSHLPERAASMEQQSPLHIRSSYPETFNVLPKVLQQVRCRRRLSSALHVGTFPSHSFIMQWSAASA